MRVDYTRLRGLRLKSFLSYYMFFSCFFFYKNIKTERSFRVFLVFFSSKPKIVLNMFLFSNAKILSRGAYLREIRIVLHCFLLTSNHVNGVRTILRYFVEIPHQSFKMRTTFFFCNPPQSLNMFLACS